MNEGTISRIGAIKKYFGTEDSPVTIHELKELSEDERQELAEGAAKELGFELIKAS